MVYRNEWTLSGNFPHLCSLPGKYCVFDTSDGFNGIVQEPLLLNYFASAMAYVVSTMQFFLTQKPCGDSVLEPGKYLGACRGKGDERVSQLVEAGGLATGTLVRVLRRSSSSCSVESSSGAAATRFSTGAASPPSRHGAVIGAPTSSGNIAVLLFDEDGCSPFGTTREVIEICEPRDLALHCGPDLSPPFLLFCEARQNRCAFGLGAEKDQARHWPALLFFFWHQAMPCLEQVLGCFLDFVDLEEFLCAFLRHVM